MIAALCRENNDMSDIIFRHNDVSEIMYVLCASARKQILSKLVLLG